MVGKNGEVEEEDAYNDGPCNGQTLIDTKQDKAQRGQDIFYGEEVDVSIADQEIHEGVDFPGSFFNVEDREVGIENGKQDNEEEREQEVMAIDVDKHMGFPIRFPANGPTAAGENIFGEWFGWLLPSIPDYSSVFIGFDHCPLSGF